MAVGLLSGEDYYYWRCPKCNMNHRADKHNEFNAAVCNYCQHVRGELYAGEQAKALSSDKSIVVGSFTSSGSNSDIQYMRSDYNRQRYYYY
jgi:Zn-finger nucleic acid-binding protein